MFVDTAAYTLFYERHFGEVFSFDWDAQNLLFDNIFYYMSNNIKEVVWFYLLISFIYFGSIWYICRRMFPQHCLASFLVYLAAFSTYSYATNGIKAGAAASFFLMALALNENKSKLKLLSFVFLVISMGFHHSMRIPVAAFIICKIIKKPWIYTAFWVFCFIIAALHITFFQEFFVGLGEELGDEKVIGYLSIDEDLSDEISFNGFRLDFILYSVVPIIVGWIGVYGRKIESKGYHFLLNLYTLINAIWLLCIYANFTNRIAYLSWLMYPIVLVYPLLRENWGDDRYVVFKYVAYGHLLFTLFMAFVYYG